MIYDPYSVIVVPFPFTDKSQTKRRPAIVLSKATYQEKTQHVSLLMVTSAKNSDWYSDYPIRDLEQTGLSTPSIVRQKIFTIDSRLVLRCVGKLSSHDKTEVIKALGKSIAF